MSCAVHGVQVQQLDELLKNISTAVTLLKQSEQQQPGTQQPAAVRTAGNAPGSGSQAVLPRSSSSMVYRDLEEGAAGADTAAGNFALSDKIRTVWSTVGRMAGFLPPVEGLGHQESLQSPHALPSTLVMHSTFSTTSGEASPNPSSLHHLQMAHKAAGSGDLSSVLGAAAAGGSGAAGGYRAAAARQLGGGQGERQQSAAAAGVAGASSAAGAPATASGYQQSRSGRVLGSSGGTGSVPGISVSEVYPNV
jgi:hypothetical protein